MIEEQFVSFDTAKKLKEVGFDAPCYVQYSDRGVQWDASYPENFNADDWGYSCPTQALAARWLREVHHLHVFAFFDYVERDWTYCVADISPVTAEGGMDLSESNYPTYEEAMQDALQEAIKLIKNK